MRELLGQVVWTNCIGFIRMAPPTRPGDLRQPPGLEGARVHPESYKYARIICFNAVADEDEEETPEAEHEAVFKAMWPDGAITPDHVPLRTDTYRQVPSLAVTTVNDRH